MKKRTRYSVFYGKDEIARFSDWRDTLIFAREASRKGGVYTFNTGPVEVEAIEGIVAQFENGAPTPKFAHLAATLDG